MKKGIALLLTGCILMSMLTGCGNSTDNKTEEVSGQGRQEENQEQVHLTFLTNEAAGDEYLRPKTRSIPGTSLSLAARSSGR